MSSIGRPAGEAAPHRGLSRPRKNPIESRLPPWYTYSPNHALRGGSPPIPNRKATPMPCGSFFTHLSDWPDYDTEDLVNEVEKVKRGEK